MKKKQSPGKRTLQKQGSTEKEKIAETTEARERENWRDEREPRKEKFEQTTEPRKEKS